MLNRIAIHKYFGYFIIFTVQGVVLTGILRKWKQQSFPETDKGIYLAVSNVVLFFFLIGVAEAAYRQILKTYIPFKSVLDTMTSKEFARLVLSDRKLMIIDNLVIDVGEFINEHPGGRFVIQHNIGTDISKFFFGGYCLEGNLEGVAQGYNHSSFARMIVTDLSIAIYEPDIMTASKEVTLEVERSALLTPDLINVCFESGSIQPGWKHYY